MVALRVGVLGPVTTWHDGHEVPAGQPRQLAVLGVLATRANHVVSRGDLIDAVWGDDPPASAEGGIYTYVAGLRRIFEPDRSQPDRSKEKARRAPSRVLVSAGGGYMLLTGMHVPIARSFAMAALFTLAVMLGRRAISLRGLGLAECWGGVLPEQQWTSSVF